MQCIVACNDLLKYASLRAEPDYRYASSCVMTCLFSCVHI